MYYTKLFLFILSISHIGLVFSISPVTFNDSDDDPQETIERLEYIDQTLCLKILNNAPKVIKEIVYALAHYEHLKQLTPQKVLLVGPPGVGKTTLAVAIAQITQRECLMVRAPFVADQYKNSGAKNLEGIFQSLIEKKHPCVLVIDEINCLTDRHKDPHNADANLAEALWLALDVCKLHPHIFIIATTNDASKMPVQLKNRFEGCTIEIPLKDTFEHRTEILQFYFQKTPCSIPKNVISWCAQKTKSFSVRQLEELVRQTTISALLRSKENPEITCDDVKKALNNFEMSNRLLFPWFGTDYKQLAWYGLTIGPTICSMIYWGLVIYKQNKF